MTAWRHLPRPGLYAVIDGRALPARSVTEDLVTLDGDPDLPGVTVLERGEDRLGARVRVARAAATDAYRVSWQVDYRGTWLDALTAPRDGAVALLVWDEQLAEEEGLPGNASDGWAAEVSLDELPVRVLRRPLGLNADGAEIWQLDDAGTLRRTAVETAGTWVSLA